MLHKYGNSGSQTGVIDLSSHSRIPTHTHVRTTCSIYKRTQICVLENGSSGVKNIDVLICAHVAGNQWLQRFCCVFVLRRGKCNDNMLNRRKLGERAHIHRQYVPFALTDLLFPKSLLEQSCDCEQNSDRNCC